MVEIPRNPKNALLGIEFDAVCSEFGEGLLKIGYEVVGPFRFDHDVINVGLNVRLMRSPKHLSLQCWYVALAFFRLNGIVM